jgi:histidyl-tRNA synthetase
MMGTQPARGMRDFLPQDVRRREHVVRVIRDVYDRHGFEPLETPAVENIETLLGKYGDEGNKLIFKILKRGEHEATGQADLALRYDLTVPLARVVAEYQAQLPKFFKRYQIQPVWRADRPARGRFREFYQCDIDAIGSASPIVEAEQITAVSEIFTTLGFEDFSVRLNHRGVLTGMLTAARIPETLHADALVALDKRDKIGVEGVKIELSQRGLEEAVVDQLLAITAFPPTAVDALAELDELQSRIGGDPAAASAIENLRQIIQLSRGAGIGGELILDKSLARGLSYYTGAIMEINVPDLAGSLGGGGRYDGLIGMFSGEEIPACGFSLGLERILVVMTERQMFPPHVQAVAAEVMVTLFDEDGQGPALELARDLRTAGVSVEVYPELDKLGKQFKYASTRGIPFVTVVGADERAAGQVTIKNMVSGEQTTVPREDAANWLTTVLGR